MSHRPVSAHERRQMQMEMCRGPIVAVGRALMYPQHVRGAAPQESFHAGYAIYKNQPEASSQMQACRR